MKVILFVRYSVVVADGATGAFLASQASRDDYIASLLDPERLKIRAFLFKNVVLASLCGQTVDIDPAWFRLAVSTSHHLPSEARRDLEDAVRPYPWAKVETDRSFSAITTDFLSEGASGVPLCFASMRLDDDDALGRTYLESVVRYCREPFVDHIVSYTSGYVARFKRKQLRLTRFGVRYHPLNSVGMTYIGRFDPATKAITSQKSSVFEAGSHARVDRSFPVVSNAVKPMFLRCIHGGQDTASVSRNELLGSSPVGLDHVLKHVALSPALFGRE